MAASSRAAATPSTNPTGSEAPAWAPTGRPTVRLTIQAARQAPLVTMAATRTTRVRRTTVSTAKASWTHPATRNMAPSTVDPPQCTGTITRWMIPAPASSAASNQVPGLAGRGGSGLVSGGDHTSARSDVPAMRSLETSSTRSVIGSPPAAALRAPSETTALRGRADEAHDHGAA